MTSWSRVGEPGGSGGGGGGSPIDRRDKRKELIPLISKIVENY